MNFLLTGGAVFRDGTFQNMDVEVEKLKNSTTRFKGYFTNETNLKNKFPSPKRGDIAFVGEPYPGNVYDVLTDGSWHNTTKAPETGSVDLQDYVTKDDFEASQKEQDDKLTELENKITIIGDYTPTEEKDGLQSSSLAFVYFNTFIKSGTEIVIKITANHDVYSQSAYICYKQGSTDDGYDTLFEKTDKKKD